MKNLGEKTKRLVTAAAAVLLAAAVLAGCASPVQSGSSQPQAPADEAAIPLAVPETEPLIDPALVEGENQVLFVQDEQREQYIPQTGWRQAERSAPEEICTLTVVWWAARRTRRRQRLFLGPKPGVHAAAGAVGAGGAERGPLAHFH